MNYLDVYKKRISHLGTNPQERAFNSGILEFRRYLKYNQHTVRGLINEVSNTKFDGVILTDKEDENRVSQILLVELEVPVKTGNLILWNNEHWLVYRKTTSSYQPYQKFYMVRCNHYIKWVDSDGSLKESWIYLVGSKDSKIKDNFRTWNEMITPQPNKYINIILPHVLMPINTEIMVLDEVWYLVDYDQNSVPGVIFMSFTETNLNLQRDNLNEQIANKDSLAQWSISAAKEQRVKPHTIINVECQVLKNGILQELEPNELRLSVKKGNLQNSNGVISSIGEGTGEILVTYKNATFVQNIIVSKEPSIDLVLVGNDKMRVAQSSEYILEGADEVEFTISDKKLATIKYSNNKCIVTANSNNKLGKVSLIASYQGKEYSKEIQIVSLWQVI